MDGDRRRDVVIIGAGMAGLATAIWARRLGLTALVLERETKAGGQLTAIGGRIVDYPGLDLPDGAALTDRLVRQATAAGAELWLDHPVQAISAANQTCATAAGAVGGRALVLATGITARHLGVPGEEELHRRRLIRRPSHDLPWFRGRRVAVIGGGDRATENALLLTPVAERILLLNRGERLRARSEFADQLLSHDHIALYGETRVTGFDVTAEGIITRAERAGESLALPVDAVCIYIGNRANTDLVQGQVELDQEGHIVTDRYGQTSHPGIYAVGDVCTLPPYQSLSTAAGQAMVVAKQIALQQGSA